MVGDEITRVPRFDWAIFGEDGCRLIECIEAYKYESSHTLLGEMLSTDACLVDHFFIGSIDAAHAVCG